MVCDTKKNFPTILMIKKMSIAIIYYQSKVVDTLTTNKGGWKFQTTRLAKITRGCQ